MCSSAQKQFLLESMQPFLFQISCEKVGTYALQNIIGGLTLDSHAKIIADGLASCVKGVICDHHGTHVIQRCQQLFSFENLRFVFTTLIDKCVEIATHQHGIVVLRNCLERSTKSEQLQLAAIITDNALLLTKNAFGNYAVQVQYFCPCVISEYL